TMTSSTATDGSAARSNEATCSACQRARADPRVAIRMSVDGSVRSGAVTAQARAAARSLDAEEVAQAGEEALAAGGAGCLLERHRGLVEQLGDEALGEGVDGGPLLVGELGEALGVALELGGAEGLGPGPQRDDHRGDLAGGGGDEVAVELLVEQRLHEGDLAPPGLGAGVGEGPEVGHVAEGDA